MWAQSSDIQWRKVVSNLCCPPLWAFTLLLKPLGSSYHLQGGIWQESHQDPARGFTRERQSCPVRSALHGSSNSSAGWWNNATSFQGTEVPAGRAPGWGCQLGAPACAGKHQPHGWMPVGREKRWLFEVFSMLVLSSYRLSGCAIPTRFLKTEWPAARSGLASWAHFRAALSTGGAGLAGSSQCICEADYPANPRASRMLSTAQGSS